MENLERLARRPCNEGILVGSEAVAAAEVGVSIRVRPEMNSAHRELELFNLAIDSNLRANGLSRFRLEDMSSGNSVKDRAAVADKKTDRTAQFEITEQTKAALTAIFQQALADGYVIKDFDPERRCYILANG